MKVSQDKGINSIQNKYGINKSNEHAVLFCIGCLFGFLCFVSIYGFRVLNTGYDSWLMMGDMDLSQHYNGWLHYRMDPWHFPFGLIDSLSKPISVSVLYTDSIPLFAVIFKLFRNILPTTFQYFGIYGLICFMLQGGLSAILIRRFCEKKWLCILGSLLFILNFPLLQRMFYHTALSSHWIIILSLVIWFYCENTKPVNKGIIYAALGILCVFIHSYYLPMVGAILLAAVVDKYLKTKSKKELGYGALQIIAFCVAALISLFCLGGFYGESAGIGEGIGSFTSNLNTFFNSLDMGRIGISFPLYYEFQYEGYAYLGMGFVMLLLLCLCLWVSSCILVFACEENDYTGESYVRIFKKYMKKHPTKTVLIVLFVFMSAMAILPMVTANDRKLFGLPLPSVIKKAWNIFRSNGRFIWVPMYLLIISMIVYIERHAKEAIVIVLFSIVTLLQIVDISKIAGEKRGYFATEQKYNSLYDDEELKSLCAGRNEFVFMYNENDIIMDTARYAYFNDMSLNNFYYARDIDEQVMREIDKWSEEFNNDTIKDDVIYIFKKSDYKSGENKNIIELERADHIFVTAK